MLRIELIYDWMCDMSSCVDAINNNKSMVRFRWFVIFSQDYFFQPPPTDLMASLGALVHSIIKFVIHLLETHLFS